jgi:DNA-binding protein HU-beta
VNKTELIDAIAEKTGWSRSEAQQALTAVIDVISDNVASGEKVSITGFGSFEKRERAARTARNPQTGEAIKVKKTQTPKFTAGAQLKKYVAMSKKDQTALRKNRG